MPKISTERTPPNDTTLTKFQEALEENALAIQTYDTDLGHLALVIKDSEYLVANGGTFFNKPANHGTASALSVDYCRTHSNIRSYNITTSRPI